MVDKFVEYGRNYVQFFIVDNEKEEEWKDLDYQEFCQALANANCPPFDPVADLRAHDEDGILYDVATWAAWGELVAAVARVLLDEK